MTLILIGIYSIFLAFIWGFFLVSKIHAYKFKNFSDLIVKNTNILFLLLSVLTILGFILIFSLNTSDFSKIDFSKEIESSYY